MTQHRRTWQRHETVLMSQRDKVSRASILMPTLTDYAITPNCAYNLTRALGTERAAHWPGPTGGADVRTGWLVAECKSWRRLPTRVVAALEQAERAARDGQLPVAVLHQVGQRRENDLVVLRWGDFRSWFGGPNGAEGNEDDSETEA
jgi:hypothetical protein